jgi:hypothetical protein
LRFTIEKEQNNQIDVLDITIRKEHSHIRFDIYKKPTATDIIIPQESCHPTDHKLSAIRYSQNRNKTDITDAHNKQQEQRIINHILHNNHYDPDTLRKQRNKKHGTEPKVQRKNGKNSLVIENKPDIFQIFQEI